jgi:hypothetical protein
MTCSGSGAYSTTPESICAGTWKIDCWHIAIDNRQHCAYTTVLAVVNTVLAGAYVARQHCALAEATIPF